MAVRPVGVGHRCRMFRIERAVDRAGARELLEQQKVARLQVQLARRFLWRAVCLRGLLGRLRAGP